MWHWVEALHSLFAHELSVGFTIVAILMAIQMINTLVVPVRMTLRLAVKWQPCQKGWLFGVSVETDQLSVSIL